jgi:hypothetical protein
MLKQYSVEKMQMLAHYCTTEEGESPNLDIIKAIEGKNNVEGR